MREEGAVKRAKSSKASVKLRIECLLGWISQQQIKQKPDRDENTEAKKQLLRYETNLLTSKTNRVR